MGALYIKQMLMDQGNYFTASNLTLGTPSTFALASSFTSSKAMFMFANTTTSISTGKTIIVDRIRLMLSTDTAPATATYLKCAMRIDPSSRATSGNTTLKTTATGVNPAFVGSSAITGVAIAPICQLSAFSSGQMIVTTEGSSVRQVGQGQINFGTMVIGDIYDFRFGTDGADASYSKINTSVGSSWMPGRYIEYMSPCVISPYNWGVFHLWIPGAVTSTPAFEYEVSWWEI